MSLCIYVNNDVTYRQFLTKLMIIIHTYMNIFLMTVDTINFNAILFLNQLYSTYFSIIFLFAI